MTSDLRDQIVEAAIAYHAASVAFATLPPTTSRARVEEIFEAAGTAEERVFELVQMLETGNDKT